jgi:N-acetylglucosaminyl-diphospho-decaprenol L-rhamnosyltransferase
MIVVSIVSHGHGNMVATLVTALLRFESISEIVVTLNIPETLALPNNIKIKKIVNIKPIGFGENHNNAFRKCGGEYFCVLNPDIILKNDVFTGLIKLFNNENVALVAPLVRAVDGKQENSWRKFPTIASVFYKVIINGDDGIYSSHIQQSLCKPDWVGGMFMLFRSVAFKKIAGFDNSFFLYYEDVDICYRLNALGYIIEVSNEESVLHDARRDSHRRSIFFYWHLKSMLYYFYKRIVLKI